MKGRAERKLQAITIIIVSTAAEQFRGGERLQNTVLKQSKSSKDLQHQAGDESTKISVQGSKRRGMHWLGSADVHPTQEDQSPPPGRASKEAWRKGLKTCCLYC